MNNLVPFQLPEASLRDLGWNLALDELARTLPFVPRRFSKYCESLLGHLPRWR